MKKLINWLDENILTIFSFFLLVFIPLYPKVPLLEAIPGYIVRVRVEDFLVLFAFIIFIIQVIRKKATYKSIIFWPIVIYLIIGLLSTLSAIFITKTVPFSQIHVVKIFLHWFRRIEYFSIFFIFYNGMRKLKNTKLLIFLSAPTLILISIYGYGQKYLYWPVYSTMNREFSKGMKLYLTEHARVPSTFGGHYDLAAFLVIFLTIFVVLSVVLKNKWLKLLFLIVFLVSYWLLILTASRTSFIAYLVALTVAFSILAWKKNWLWALLRWLGFMIFSLFIMFSFGDLSERFSHFLGMPAIKEKLQLDNFLKPLRAPPSSNFIPLSGDLQLVMDRTDERPVEEKPSSSSNLPPDVYENIPDYWLASGSGTATRSARLTASQSGMIAVNRTFSENAYKYGLSTAIRLDATWPWAIAGFKKNPLLGSGYSTLSKSSIGQFTEAESTDNDYLRALGETGLLGFISFFGIIIITIVATFKSLARQKDLFLLAFTISFIAFSLGLLVNATYIDVFEASKVAFIYWALSGVVLASLSKTNIKQINIKK